MSIFDTRLLIPGAAGGTPDASLLAGIAAHGLIDAAREPFWLDVKGNVPFTRYRPHCTVATFSRLLHSSANANQ